MYPAGASGCACMYSLTSRDPNGVSMTSSRDPRANTPLPHYLIPRHRNCLGHKNIIVNEWLDDPPTSPTPDHILDSGMAQTTPRYRLAPALRLETPCTLHRRPDMPMRRTTPIRYMSQDLTYDNQRGASEDFVTSDILRTRDDDKDSRCHQCAQETNTTTPPKVP